MPRHPVAWQSAASCAHRCKPSAAAVRPQPYLMYDIGERVGAEDLRHQAIFVNHAPGAIAPLDPELIRIRDAVGQLP